jgi:hypothetical protein
MSQRMRADAGADAAGEGVPADEAIHAPDGQPRASIVDEQRIDGMPLTRCWTCEKRAVFEICPDGGCRRLVERHQPLLAAFAQCPDHLGADVHVVHIEPDEFAEPQTGRIEQFENRPIAPAERPVVVRRLEQADHLLFRQMNRHADFALRRRHQRPGIVVHESFATEVPEKRSGRRELARGGCARLAAVVQLRQKRSHRRPIEARGTELDPLDALDPREVFDQLRQVAFVGTDGVPRRCD